MLARLRPSLTLRPPPEGIRVPGWVFEDPQGGSVPSGMITVGLDVAKTVFQVHGAGRAMLRRKLRRAQVLEFVGPLPPCVVAMEACGGAHFWGREIGRLGHDVLLLPPVCIKPS